MLRDQQGNKKITLTITSFDFHPKLTLNITSGRSGDFHLKLTLPITQDDFHPNSQSTVTSGDFHLGTTWPPLVSGWKSPEVSIPGV